MATDITKSIAANTAKHGTAVVLGASANPLNNNTIDEHGLSVPSVSYIEERYDTRFDDPTYYGTTSVLQSQLKASYRLDETSGTRSDLSGFNQDLTDNNTVGYAAGKQSNAASLVSANNEFLSIADSSLGDLSPGNINFSIGFWIYFNSAQFSNNQVVAGIWNTSGSNREWLFRLAGSNSKLVFRTSPDGATQNNLSTGALSADTWYNIVAIHDVSSGARRLYVNNSQVATDSNTGTTTGDGDFVIGCYQNQTQFFDGRIDEFNLWHKVLSASDISSFYNSGNGTQVK